MSNTIHLRVLTALSQPLTCASLLGEGLDEALGRRLVRLMRELARRVVGDLRRPADEPVVQPLVSDVCPHPVIRRRRDQLAEPPTPPKQLGDHRQCRGPATSTASSTKPNVGLPAPQRNALPP
jgi:hypothetical protein